LIGLTPRYPHAINGQTRLPAISRRDRLQHVDKFIKVFRLLRARKRSLSTFHQS
jgi:hypothetical protein